MAKLARCRPWCSRHAPLCAERPTKGVLSFMLSAGRWSPENLRLWQWCSWGCQSQLQKWSILVNWLWNFLRVYCWKNPLTWSNVARRLPDCYTNEQKDTLWWSVFCNNYKPRRINSSLSTRSCQLESSSPYLSSTAWNFPTRIEVSLDA